MKNLFLLFLFLIVLGPCRKLHAQYTGLIWCFGDSSLINFNNGLSNSSSSCTGRGSCASICNQNGDLLFYCSDGTRLPGTTLEGIIHNRNHLKMTGGDSLIAVDWYHEMIIVPKSEIDSTFYVFSAGVATNFGLYYSLVDLKLNNGLGQVVQKNIQLQSFPIEDKLVAVKHGNGHEWWLIFEKWDPANLIFDNLFYSYLITDSGIGNLISQNVGPIYNSTFGQLCFNSDGTQFVLVSAGGLISTYSFDRCTGVISNPNTIEPEPMSSPYSGYFSCALSPNGRFLYICSVPGGLTLDTNYVYQFDLLAPNISASKIILHQFPVSEVPLEIKIGPDNKLYFSTMYAGPGSSYPFNPGFYNTVNNNLSVINYPDSAGAACDLQLYSIPLGTGRTYFGLPNNPDYELGAWVGSPCDTLSVGLPQPTTPAAPFFQAWYNPEWDMIHVNASGLKGSKGSLRVFDTEGRIVYEKNIAVIPGGYVATEIPVNNFASGIYIVSLVTEKDLVSEKIRK